VHAPIDEDDGLSVSVINYSMTNHFEIPAGQWMPRFSGGSIELPVEGAIALVLFDDDGDAWVVGWSNA
jgi:hypothetical protein